MRLILMGRGWLALALLLVLPGMKPVQAQTSEIRGRVMDRETGEAVQDAAVILEGQDTVFMMVTDQRGLFDFSEVGEGEYRVMVRHLAYGEHVQDITVEPEVMLALRILISQQAIELDPVVVEAMSERELRDRSRGTMIQEVTRPEIERAARTSQHLGDILRQTVPGLRVSDTNFSPGSRICLEFRGRRSIRFANACQMPVLILDGVRMHDPGYLLSTIDPSSIQRIEVVPPGEAGLLYGSESAFGVLVIETRLWRDGEERESLPAHLRGGVYDWSLELVDHSWKKVLISSFVGNALGVAAGIAIADRCVRFDELATDIFASDCDQLATAGGWVAGITLPLAGAALASRYAGSTPISRGRLVPTMVSGAIALMPGYALIAASQREPNSPSFRVGQVLVMVGIPLAVTAADRIFRKFRGS